MSQNSEILTSLLCGERLTSLDSLNRFGCMRLAARIKDLKEKGYVIHSNPLEGNKKGVVVYHMDVLPVTTI